MMEINTKFLADALVSSYRDGASDEKERIVKLLEGILESRAKVSAVHSQTISIHELLRLIGEKNV